MLIYNDYESGAFLPCVLTGKEVTYVIVKSLVERGIKNQMGNDFTGGAIGRILKNRKYIGEYKYGDVVIPDGIPKIISEELFERVQIRMKANSRAPAKAKATEEYLLTTKLFCGNCG